MFKHKPAHQALRARGRRSAFALASLVLAGGALAACGSDGDSGSESSGKIRTTLAPGMGSLPFRVALEKDYFGGCGLEVEVTEGFDIPSYLAALGRQFDSVMLVPTLSVPAAAAGLDLRAFGGMEAVDPRSSPNPVVTNHADITSIEDLANQGGTLGVVAAGDDFSAYFETLFKGTDVDPKGIKQVTVPFADMADQLKAGRIDAFVGAAGFFEYLLADPAYHVIADFPVDVVEAAGIDAPTTWPHFVTSGEFANGHMDELKCFVDSLHKAEDWIGGNKEGALAIYAEWVGVTEAETKFLKIPLWQDVNEETYEAWQTILDNGGVLEGSIDPSKIVLDFD